MTLSTTEMQWVTGRMKIYDIKYQEIYYEILDHIITAIEAKRDDGDTRDIAIIFQDVVDDHFGGYNGIEDLAVKQEEIYNTYIGGLSKKIFKSYLNWKVLAFTLLAASLAYSLPNTKMMHIVFFVAILLLAFSPIMFAFIKIKQHGRTMKGKRSLLKGRLISQTYLPGMLLNGIIYLPVIFAGGLDGDNGFKIMQHWPLPVLMLMLIFFALLNLSAVSLCRQVLKKQTSYLL